jgi:hypothetical protein
MEFIGFDTPITTCGSRQAALMPYKSSADYVPFSQFFDPIFTDLDKDSLAFIPNPPQGWANPTDCVDFTCTGLYNVAILLENPRYNGNNIPNLPTRTYEIISNNIESTSAQAIPNCDYQEGWNAWLCTGDKVGVMIIDSRDADRMDRASQPLYIQNENLCRNFEDEDGEVEKVCFDNRLNAYMDHCWDGFYTC